MNNNPSNGSGAQQSTHADLELLTPRRRAFSDWASFFPRLACAEDGPRYKISIGEVRADLCQLRLHVRRRSKFRMNKASPPLPEQQRGTNRTTRNLSI
jgi:hypothetical protein